ncbi:MAG: S-layer homology domain-containing protein, partial [Oscillospiraceae bacterium]|nr:S-layer homology domain-containing protein [Oscillospiraceae bacterium]
MFKKAKKAISIAICLMMLFTVMPSNAAINFQDVPNSHWAKAYIDEFVAKEYINGRSDTVFDPEAPVNRAEFAAIIYRIFKDMLDPPPAPTADPAAPTADPAAPTVLPAPTVAPPLTFPDVKDADWFYAAVMAAAKAKITNGFEDGSFRPTVSITRQDAATMILRTFAALEAEFKGNDAIELTDLDKVATYAKVAVETLAKNGVINGYEDKSFRPTQSITRAETVKILKVTKDRYDGIYG